MTPRRVLITGAGGYLGRALTQRLTAASDVGAGRLTLLDLQPFDAPAGASRVEGDLAEPQTLLRALAEPVDLVFHLASLPGGAAESDPAASRRVNLDASLALFERLAGQATAPRVVFASTIGVFGAPLPPMVDDDTAPRPAMTYGAHKLMVEVALADWSRRGGLDGISLRLPGIVARPRQGAGFRSAFLSDLFHALASGERFRMPVRADGTSWLLSLGACVDSLLHAADVELSLDTPRAVTLPALRPTMAELATAIASRTGADPELVAYDPDPVVDLQFARHPPLLTAAADALGFRHDGDLNRLVERVLATIRSKEAAA